MHHLDRFLECRIPGFGGFQYKKNFLCFNNFSLPTIYRLNPWDNTRTGSQLRLHYPFADSHRFFLIYHRNQDNKNLSCRLLHKGHNLVRQPFSSATTATILDDRTIKQFLGQLRIEAHDFHNLSMPIEFCLSIYPLLVLFHA